MHELHMWGVKGKVYQAHIFREFRYKTIRGAFTKNDLRSSWDAISNPRKSILKVTTSKNICYRYKSIFYIKIAIKLDEI